MRRLSLTLILMLASCASFGTRVTPEMASKIKPGLTKAEVRAILGNPQMDMPIYGGGTQWTYTYSHAQSFLFATSGNMSQFIVKFDRKGKVVIDGDSGGKK